MVRCGYGFCLALADQSCRLVAIRFAGPGFRGRLSECPAPGTGDDPIADPGRAEPWVPVHAAPVLSALRGLDHAASGLGTDGQRRGRGALDVRGGAGDRLCQEPVPDPGRAHFRARHCQRRVSQAAGTVRSVAGACAEPGRTAGSGDRLSVRTGDRPGKYQLLGHGTGAWCDRRCVAVLGRALVEFAVRGLHQDAG